VEARSTPRPRAPLRIAVKRSTDCFSLSILHAILEIGAERATAGPRIAQVAIGTTPFMALNRAAGRFGKFGFDTARRARYLSARSLRQQDAVEARAAVRSSNWTVRQTAIGTGKSRPAVWRSGTRKSSEWMTKCDGFQKSCDFCYPGFGQQASQIAQGPCFSY
jgi:hypothetical protein